MGNSQSSGNAAGTDSTFQLQPPWFTHGLESPPFVTLESKEGYEVRKYKPSKWVGVQQDSTSCKTASSDSFWPLFKFISGENEAKKKIPMTSPVTVKIPAEVDSNNKERFTTHFYLPYQYQEVANSDLPKPNNSNVSFYDYPEITVYVLSYGGFTSDAKLAQHSKQLSTLLERDGLSYDKDVSFYAGYDPPYRLFNRHNEIWFVSNDKTTPTEEQ